MELDSENRSAAQRKEKQATLSSKSLVKYVNRLGQACRGAQSPRCQRESGQAENLISLTDLGIQPLGTFVTDKAAFVGRNPANRRLVVEGSPEFWDVLA